MASFSPLPRSCRDADSVVDGVCQLWAQMLKAARPEGSSRMFCGGSISVL